MYRVCGIINVSNTVLACKLCVSPTIADGRCCRSSYADIVEGKVSKGIYLKEEKGVTLLYYGRYKASCISSPAQCDPDGE